MKQSWILMCAVVAVVTGCGGIDEQAVTDEQQMSPVDLVTAKNNACGCTQFAPTISELTAQHAGCDSANMSSLYGYSGACIAAANRYCTNKGYQSGTIVELSLPNTEVSCLDSVDFQLPVSALTPHHAQCTGSNVVNAKHEYTRACNMAANRFCKAKGYATGMLQEYNYVNQVEVSCVNKPVGTGYKTAVPFSTWSAYQSDCDAEYTYASNTKSCRSAAHRYCKVVHGTTSGIIVEWGSGTNDLVCLG
jgi:hypothetical protein